MAAVRLRKAFRYPEESDEREELDEEEQEKVIEQLQSQNDTRNAQYSMVFTVLPILTATIFVPSVLSASLTERLLSFLGLVSLLTTAYIMRCSPLHPDLKGKKAMNLYNERLAQIHAALVPATGAISLLLALVYLSTSSYGSRPIFYLIPGAMLGVVLLAQRVMRSVDLASLKDLQYEYKGA